MTFTHGFIFPSIMSSILNVFLTALLMYSQSPHTQDHQIIPLTYDSGDTRTELFGDQRNKPQPQRPLLQPCPRVSKRQVLSSTYIQPAPSWLLLPLLPSLSALPQQSSSHLSWPAWWLQGSFSCLCRHTPWTSLCFVIPEVSPVPVTTSFQSCPPLSHFGVQPLLPGTQPEEKRSQSWAVPGEV